MVVLRRLGLQALRAGKGEIGGTVFKAFNLTQLLPEAIAQGMDGGLGMNFEVEG
uniref:Uncharacterized protein n=1 Tax=Desertifilum tharense IPPAS B-1220 TaxID=1781255 RepID=A0ACD5GYB9_9CYAN